MRRIAALFVSIALLIVWLPTSVLADTAEIKDNTIPTASKLSVNSYREYLEQHGSDFVVGQNAVLMPKTATVNGIAAAVQEVEGKKGFRVESGEAAAWKFSIPKDGYYELTVEYLAVDGTGGSMERDLYLDGQVPFTEARGLLFKREYAYESEQHFNAIGNQLQPEKQELRQWHSHTVRSSAGYISDPLRFYLTAGEHTLMLQSVREPIVYGTLIFGRDKELPTYAEVKAEYDQMGYTDAEASGLYLPAEEPTAVSDFSIYPTTDRTSAYTEPSADKHLLINVIGGTNWASSGQYVRYTVRVEKSGLYTIGFRFKQNTMQGLSVYRRLTIDGKIPFAEAASLRFVYSGEWQYAVIGNGNEAYRFYFEAGREYSLALDVTCGEYAGVLERMNMVLTQLNGIYRSVLMITGPDPDLYRDYHFTDLLPDTIKKMAENADLLENIREEIRTISGSAGIQVSAIDNLIVQLRQMSEKPERKIAAELTNYQSNVSSLGTWIMNATGQPLMLDAIQIGGTETVPLKGDTGFFGTIVYEVRRLIASFFDDYADAVIDSNAGIKAVDVWTYSGRDQAQILSNLIDNRYVGDGKTKINLKLVAGGTLMPSILAGKGPDVSLGAGSTEPINLAIRNAVMDLTVFEGFNEVATRFNPSAVVPFTFRNAVYAIPETENFPVLFYRTDILQELNLSVPNTWDELFDDMLELQTNNLNVGIPTAYGGFMMFLLQQNGQLYSDDGKTSLLDDDVALASFKRFTDYFVLYDFPVQYDFANRFRSGEMPMAIQSYTAYNQLVLFAPEIKGLWQMAPIPGTVQEDGTVNRSAPGTVSGTVILKFAKHPETCWDFVKWWTSAEIQGEFGTRMESILGESGKYHTANREAMTSFSWSHSNLEALTTQWDSVVGIPEVPGGYYSSRYVDFAYNSVINQSADPVEALERYVPTITSELQRKSAEFGY